VSFASLIIALGLLVDVRVISGDAIMRELASGQPSSAAAWLGPTKLPSMPNALLGGSLSSATKEILPRA